MTEKKFKFGLCEDGSGEYMILLFYSDNQKTLKQEDDFQTQVMTLNSP